MPSTSGTLECMCSFAQQRAYYVWYLTCACAHLLNSLHTMPGTLCTCSPAWQAPQGWHVHTRPFGFAVATALFSTCHPLHDVFDFSGRLGGCHRLVKSVRQGETAKYESLVSKSTVHFQRPVLLQARRLSNCAYDLPTTGENHSQPLHLTKC